MLILTIRTDKPESEIGLYEDSQQLAYTTWQAHRELARTIHTKIKEILDKAGKDWSGLEGFVVYKGPGSFTGLRIGLAAANALAYGLKKPIIATTGESWLSQGIQGLRKGEGKTLELPEYGADPKTTQQRK